MEEKNKVIYEENSVLDSVIRLAMPSVMGQIILVIYNMADTFFTGLTGSDIKITAVSICMPAFMYLSAIANMFGVGGSAVMSRYLGYGQEDDARKSSSFSFWGCLILASLYCGMSFLLIDLYINALGGVDQRTHLEARKYLMFAVIIGGIPTALSNLFAHLLRAEGKSMQASAGISLGGILNIILDPLFMFVIMSPGNEVLGAAIATMVSNVIVLGYFVFLYVKNSCLNKTIICIDLRQATNDKNIMRQVIFNGLPAALMTFCENLSYTILDKIVSNGGVAMQAGLGVAKKINMMAHCIVRGMSQGVLSLIAYNYASKNYKRMRSAFRISASISVCLAVFCMTFDLIFSRQLIRLFITNESQSYYYGIYFLRVLCIGAPFSAFAYAVISFFQAVGKVRIPLRLALLRKGIIDIPLMIVLYLLINESASTLATPIADVICCVLAIVLFIEFMKKKILKNQDNCIKLIN